MKMIFVQIIQCCEEITYFKIAYDSSLTCLCSSPATISLSSLSQNSKTQILQIFSKGATTNTLKRSS
ncbi:hypothetical protein P8452_58014 [Trifolium repens]|nr:hypothetical protein P8452_58014 [Trifolium repens]